MTPVPHPTPERMRRLHREPPLAADRALEFSAREHVLIFGDRDLVRREVSSMEAAATAAGCAAGRAIRATMEGGEVIATGDEAAALARRVLSRDPQDGLQATCSLFIDRSAEALLEDAETAGGF